MTHEETIGGIPLEFEYTYTTHMGRKFPKILSIEFRGYNLTEIVDHIVIEETKSRIFKKLNEDYKLGIVSSNSEENIRIVLRRYKIENLFEFVYSSSSIFGKHLVLKRMCKKYKINPNSIIYIGDEDRDIIAAKKAKIKIIAVTWGFNSEKLLKEEKPDYLVNAPKEILEKIL